MNKENYHCLLDWAQAWIPNVPFEEREKIVAAITFTTFGETKASVIVSACCGTGLRTIDVMPRTEAGLYFLLDSALAEAIDDRDEQHRAQKAAKDSLKELAAKIGDGADKPKAGGMRERLQSFFDDRMGKGNVQIVPLGEAEEEPIDPNLAAFAQKVRAKMAQPEEPKPERRTVIESGSGAARRSYTTGIPMSDDQGEEEESPKSKAEQVADRIHQGVFGDALAKARAMDPPTFP